MILRVENLRKSYQSPSGPPIEILKGLSFEVPSGKTMSIMGPSGCGKSTLAGVITALDPADSGQIYLDGQAFSSLSADELSRFRSQNIGLIFQQFHLIPHLTAFENILLPLDFHKVPSASEVAKKILSQVGLAHRMDHFPHQMSRGECQRVAIARVISLRPKIIVADEPTGSLDQKTSKEVMDLLFQLVNQVGSTLILVTHDPAWAEQCQIRARFVDGHLEIGESFR